MVVILQQWRRVDENRPFDPAEWNRFVNFLRGELASPFALVDDTGALMMSSNPSTPAITFFAPVEFQDTVLLSGTTTLSGTLIVSGVLYLGNTIYLYGRNAANNANIGLIRLNASDIIELGPADTQRMTIVSPLTNGTGLFARTAANNANILLIGLNSSNIIELGAAATRLTPLSSITNNVGLFWRNAANSADIYVTGINASDQIVTGVAGTSHFLNGTTIVPTVDPPTADGQIDAGALVKASGHVIGGGGASLGQNYNIASVARNGAGDFTVTIDRDFSAATYATVVTVLDNALNLTWRVNGQAAGSFDVHFRDAVTGVLTDPDAFGFACFGTLS